MVIRMPAVLAIPIVREMERVLFAAMGNLARN